MLKYLVGFAAILVAGCAAFFSVKGIATLFSGAFIAALIMAGALEFGKLVGVSYIHREWKNCTKFLKVYLTTAVLVLMLITSLGIFGFLSSAYQDSALKHDIHISKIEAIENRKDMVVTEITSVNSRIRSLTEARQGQEERLNTVTDQIGKTMTARSAQTLQESTQKLIEQSSADLSAAQSKLDKLSDKRISIEEEIMNAKINNEGSKDIQTFEFVAAELNMTLDSVAKWFIVTIIFVFDPLAVALVMAYNSMVIEEQRRKKVIVVEKEPEEIEELSEETVEVPQKKMSEEAIRQLKKLKHIKTKSGVVKDNNGNDIAEA